MTLPTSVFADAFRRHVTPKLRDLIVCLASQSEDYNDSIAEIIREAHRLGAGYLPDEHHHAMVEWIGATFLDEVALADEADDLVSRLMCEANPIILRREIRSFAGLDADG